MHQQQRSQQQWWQNDWRRNGWIIGVGIGVAIAGTMLNAIAAQALNELDIWRQIPQQPEFELLEPDAQLDTTQVLTERTILQDGLTVPSLWWTQELYGEKLTDGWIAYSGVDGTPRRVDLIVNQARWSNPELTYIDRYAFVTHFGIAAQSFGYQLRVFNRSSDDLDLLAAYICQPIPEGEPATFSSSNFSESNDCDLFLDPAFGYDGFSRPNPFGDF
jgi:hypothetical protein